MKKKILDRMKEVFGKWNDINMSEKMYDIKWSGFKFYSEKRKSKAICRMMAWHTKVGNFFLIYLEEKSFSSSEFSCWFRCRFILKETPLQKSDIFIINLLQTQTFAFAFFFPTFYIFIQHFSLSSCVGGKEEWKKKKRQEKIMIIYFREQRNDLLFASTLQKSWTFEEFFNNKTHSHTHTSREIWNMMKIFRFRLT